MSDFGIVGMGNVFIHNPLIVSEKDKISNCDIELLVSPHGKPISSLISSTRFRYNQ